MCNEETSGYERGTQISRDSPILNTFPIAVPWNEAIWEEINANKCLLHSPECNLWNLPTADDILNLRWIGIHILHSALQWTAFQQITLYNICAARIQLPNNKYHYYSLYQFWFAWQKQPNWVRCQCGLFVLSVWLWWESQSNSLYTTRIILFKNLFFILSRRVLVGQGRRGVFYRTRLRGYCTHTRVHTKAQSTREIRLVWRLYMFTMRTRVSARTLMPIAFIGETYGDVNLLLCMELVLLLLLYEQTRLSHTQ